VLLGSPLDAASEAHAPIAPATRKMEMAIDEVVFTWTSFSAISARLHGFVPTNRASI
jgi:hypothetical protein